MAVLGALPTAALIALPSAAQKPYRLHLKLPAPQAAASPAPGAPANPQVIMEKAKKTYKDLNDIKKELIGVKNVMEGLQTKVNKFETFKKAVVDKETKEKKKIDTSSTGDINDAIGAYKYMKDEGKTLKGEFEKTVKEQLDKLESIQKRLTAVLEAEASTPAIRNDIETITKTFEQSIEGVKDTDEKPLTNTGLLNTLKGFSQTFATDFDEAFSFAKQIAEPVIEQQERDAKLRASNPMAAQEALQARQVFDVISGKWDKIKKKIEDTTKVIDALSQDKKTNKDIELFQKYVADIKQYLNTAQVAPNKPAAESAQKEFDEVYKLLNDLINKDEFNTAIAPPATAPPENPNTTKGGAGPLTPEQTTKVIDAGITAMDTILNKLLGIYKRQSTPGYAISGATGDNLFSKIFNEYMSSRTDENEVQARNRFIEQLEVNHLIPRKVLAITTMDRILFIFITLFIRTLCTAVIVSLIERGTITQMVWAITGYMIMYSLILIAFVLLVNLDMYRMRIIFNYVNFHANSGKIYMHLGLLVVIGILIYIVITRINFPVRSVPQKAISDNQKVRLIMRFQILTGILWGILALIVALENA
jgi:hypothetical protein